MSIGDIALAVGEFSPRSQHSIGHDLLEPAIADFEAIATTFAVNAIQDEAVRKSYLRHIRDVSDQVRLEVARGALTGC